MISGCPTAISDSEVALLQKWAWGRRVVEAGALLGYSTIKLAQVCSPRLVSIDKHSGYSGPTYARYRSNLDRAGVAHLVNPVVGCVLTNLPKYEADFCFLDLTGEYNLTFKALSASKAPLIGIHDFGRINCSGVERAIKELRLNVVDLADTLVVVAR